MMTTIAVAFLDVQRTNNAACSNSPQVLMDLLWSDPTTNDGVSGVQPSPRGPGLVTFGPDRVKDFCTVRHFVQPSLLLTMCCHRHCADRVNDFCTVSCWIQLSLLLTVCYHRRCGDCGTTVSRI